MTRILTIAALAATTLLAACGEQPDPCLGATDVKQCEATRAATGGNNDALLYGVGGYLLGSMNSGGGSTHTRTIERHYYSSPRSPVTSPSRTVSTPSWRSPSYSLRSTPSYSSFRSTPSYSFRSSSVSFRSR